MPAITGELVKADPMSDPPTEQTVMRPVSQATASRRPYITMLAVHNDAVMTVLFLVLGVDLLVKGIPLLT